MATEKQRKALAEHPPPTRPPIAQMYARWTLDCVVEAVQAIALDFVKRPRQYREVPRKDPGNTSEIDVAAILSNFWFLSGTDPGFPDVAKRQMIFVPLLGPSDGQPGEHGSQFHMITAALRERARAFTERQVETGVENLRRAFVDEAITVQSYLSTLEDNSVVNIGDRQTGSIFEAARQVLLNTQVAFVFGRPPAPASEVNWPLEGSFDQNGARLIEEVTKALETSMGLTSQSQFIIMQRIAHFGANTIRDVLASDLSPDPDDIDPVIRVTYSWKTALDALGMSPN